MAELLPAQNGETCYVGWMRKKKAVVERVKVIGWRVEAEAVEPIPVFCGNLFAWQIVVGLWGMSDGQWYYGDKPWEEIATRLEG